MYDNYSYPLGADNSSAPWNQKEVPEKEFNMLCSQSLSKTVRVSTQDYNVIEEREYDKEGYYDFAEYDTSNVDWKSEYHSHDHYTPIQLINLFQKYLLDEVNGSCTVNKNTEFLNWLISECNNWEEDETVYMEDY